MPSILDWIVDFLVTPIKDAVTGVTTRLFEEAPRPVEAEIKAKLDETLERIGSSPWYGEALEPTKTLEEYKDTIFGIERDANLFALWLTGMTSVASAFPLSPIADAIDEVWRTPRIMGMMNVGVAAATSQFDAAGSLFLTQYWRDKFRPMVPDLYYICRSRAQQGLTDARFRELLGRLGFPDDLAGPMVDIQRNYPEVTVLNEMLWRGLIEEGEFRECLAKLLIPEEYSDAFVELTKRIPPPADLIRFAVREVFIPEELARMIVPGPGDEFYKWMERQGYDRFWADAYWAAHWVRPAITHLNEMYYRGVIDRDTWRREVRLNDYVPYAIDWYEKIIYRPYTRVDIRRMWDLRVVTEQEMFENYLWLGYDEEHARRMTLWSKVYELSSELRARYRRGWITKDDVRRELIEAGMPEERVDEWLETIVKAEEPARLEKERDLTKSEIGRLFKKGELTKAEATSLLISMGYDEVEAEYILRLYTEKLRQRDLTPTQTIRAVKAGIISVPAARAYLRYLGYDDFEATVLLMLYDVIEKELIA